MEITVVGSDTVVPRLFRRQSCVVVETSVETIVLDLGNGAVREMLHAGLDPFAVNRVFFTHFHPDHTVDLVTLLFGIKHGGEEEREKPLALYGPEPFKRFFGSITMSGVSGCSVTIPWRSRNCPMLAPPLSTYQILA